MFGCVLRSKWRSSLKMRSDKVGWKGHYPPRYRPLAIKKLYKCAVNIKIKAEFKDECGQSKGTRSMGVGSANYPPPACIHILVDPVPIWRMAWTNRKIIPIFIWVCSKTFAEVLIYTDSILMLEKNSIGQDLWIRSGLGFLANFEWKKF